MTTRKNHKHDIVHCNFLWDDGGAGDMIARCPAIKYIRDTQPHCVIHLWVPDYIFDVAKHLLPNDIVIKPFSKGPTDYNQELPGRKTSSLSHDTLKTHLVDHTFHVLANIQITDPKYKNYLKINPSKINITKFDLPKKYVVMTTGFTAPVREFYPKTVNELVLYIKSKGYEVVFLGNVKAEVGAFDKAIHGNFNNEIDYSQGLNLVNKTSLLEAAKIIGESKAIIGVDNGLLHLAATTDVAIVGGFTTVKPEHRMPYRHNELGWNFFPVVPSESLACRFCQSNWDHVYNGHDFRTCYYKNKGMDKEIQCVKSLTSAMFIEHLEKIL